MGIYTHQPSADWRNDGWTVVGSGVTNAWQCITGGVDDTKYIKCPASKGSCTVSFPIDIDTSAVPDGAVITSITIKVRCSTGAGTPVAGQAPSLTIGTLCSDDTSRYTTRVIYPTSTITDYTVATYTRDALGFLWDIERINHLLCRLFTYCAIFDLIRCHRFWCEITYHVRPTITVDAPSGTVTTPSPTISWTYTQTDGDPQVKAQYKLFTGVQQASVSFNPETTAPVYSTTVNGDISSVTLPTSINPDTYWVYVRSYSSFGAKSVWVGRQFVVAGPAPAPPGVPDPTGAAAPGVGVITVVPDSSTGTASLTLRDNSNMLSTQAADFENGTTDGTEYTTTNCTTAVDSSKAFPGSGSNSLKLTASSAAQMTLTSTYTEIIDQVELTARAQFMTAVTSRSCQLRVLFYDANYTALGGTLTGSTVSDSTTTWTEATVTGVGPAGAVYARVALDVLSPANAEVHNVDHVGLSYGTNSPWSSGGMMSRNLLSAWYASAEDPVPSGQSWTAGTATSTAVATSPGGTGQSGTKSHKMTYLGLSPTLAFRAAGTAFTSPTSGANYTLNKPVGTLSGDLMVAFVSASISTTITPAVGWTAVNKVAISVDGTNDTGMWILKRTAGGAEPTTWTDGVIGANAVRRHAVVVSYSGAADASQQFISEAGTTTANALPSWLTSPSVANTDPNAWRLSAFAFSDTVTGGTMTANIQQPSTIPAITFVGRATAWKDTSGGTAYTINKPSGVTTGDLMVATVGVAGSVTITAPTGWTLVRTITSSQGPFTQGILKRTATSSEPASWSSTVSGTINKTKVSQCLAYRNAADASLQFLAENGIAGGGATSIATPSVTNTNSLSWRVVAFGSTGATSSPSWSENESIERCDDNAVHSVSSWFSTTYDSSAVSMSDSNGSVGTGSYTKTGTANGSYYGAAAWIGIIKPLGSAPAGVANETQRSQTNVGSSTPWLATGVFDSAGPVAVGNTSVTGVWSASNGLKSSAAAWCGIIKPFTPVRSGYSSATMATKVDISSIDSGVLAKANGKVSVSAQFLGNVTGTPYLTVNFYRANVLLNSLTAEGSVFNAATWVKSTATFAMPDTTTRMSLTVSSADRSVSDVVYFDRVSLSLGDETVYRPGTGSLQNPVWAVPEIQYADDDGTGYGDWTTLPGQLSNPPIYDALTGLSVYVDHTVIPLTNRKYRARTVVGGLAGDSFVSDWGPDSSEIAFIAENWWLKDIKDETNNLKLKVKWDNVSIGTTNTATVFQPLGTDLPVVLTEGFKGDSFTLTLTPVGHDDWVSLRNLLRSGRTLFLQSDIDQAWWVRPVGDLGADILPTNQRTSTPMREVKVTFYQVSPEG